MAVTVPSFLPSPFADEGQRATIPATPSSEQGRASYQQGFPQVCAQPLASGGIPPNYQDFQGIFYDLSASIFYMQTGALWPWASTLTYPLGAHVLGSDSNEYVAVQASTGQDPTQDDDATYWARTASSPDGVTIANNSTNKLMAQDIAIHGDASDLASARGLFNFHIVNDAAPDLNTFTKQGVYFFYSSSAGTGANFPITQGGILVVYASSNQYIKHLYYGITSARTLVRQGGSTGWSSWSDLLRSSGVGDGIIVENGIISVPEYEGATASAPATSGLVPPATAGQQGYFLGGDGEWHAVESSLRQSMIGMVAPFACTSLPSGWMLCDGSLILFADWPDFKAAYDAGRFTGMTLSSASSSQKGKFVLKGSTGLYLPDLEGLFVQAGAATAAGAYVKPGVPDVTGSFIPTGLAGVAAPEGAFYAIASNATDYSTDTRTGYGAELGFKASLSSAIYGASSTVQPPAVKYCFAMYLGEPA